MSLQGRFGSSSLAQHLLLATLIAGFAAACSGGSGGSGSGGGPMYISTCSLGCSNGATAPTVSCSIAQHSRNGDVSVFFSSPILSTTVSPSTFQLIDVQNGQAPVGTRFVDSTDPSGTKMIFRPAVFFDNSGNTVFGFRPGATYRVTIPGQAHGDLGPFVASTSGELNQSRMQCDFTTTTQIDDLVVGPPRVSVFVQKAVAGDPTQGSDFEPADGLTDVWRDSQISIRFNDIMNPATLLNPTTHLTTLITVQVDTDGNPQHRVTLFGRVDISIDLIHLRTQLQFTPANGMPSGRAVSGAQRKVVVTIPQTVTDLVGNGVVNPGEFTFTPEVVLHPEATLPDADGENFTNTANKETRTSGADWGGGRLTRGQGGGSGRLGALRIPTLQSVTLNGDGTEFRNVSMPDFPSSFPIVRTTGQLDNAHPSETPAGPADYATNPTLWPTIVVTDAVFEFSSLEVETGSSLRLVGSKPVRIFSRGPISILGTIDVRGETPAEHDSEEPLGGPGAAGGPGGGRGGAGGDRWDNTDNFEIQGCVPPGIENPGAILNGRRGTGVGGAGTRGAGFGGNPNPDPGPTQTCMTADDALLKGILMSDPGPEPSGSDGFCTCRQVSSPGGGGAYATSGLAGNPMTSIPLAMDPFGGDPLSNLPATVAAGGDSETLGIEPADPESGHRIRLLDAPLHLKGGSGGGGGGAQLFDSSEDSSTPSSPCYDDCSFGFSFLAHYFDHSACGGGGGGGALQVVSGDRIDISGSITAAGGDGGSSMFSTLVIPPDFNGPRKSRASPGGGGSGGAVHVQGMIVEIFPRDPNDPHDAPRVDVMGGLGGVTSANYFATVSPLGEGGAGGAGLIRIEDLSGGTNPPATLLSRCSEAPKLAPFDATVDACSKATLSVGAWAPPIRRPETFSGASSCWMKAGGNYFQLDFLPDDPTETPPVFGWNMDVLYHDPVSGSDVVTTYRGRDANTPFPTGDFESNLGNAVNYLDASTPPGNEFGTGAFDPSRFGSYLSVRFQGAVADLDTVGQAPCDLVVIGSDSQIETGSLTPWVSHPSELNNFRPRPNIVRFCVVFDSTMAAGNSVGARINGVTNLRIEAQPD